MRVNTTINSFIAYKTKKLFIMFQTKAFLIQNIKKLKINDNFIEKIIKISQNIYNWLINKYQNLKNK